uniref:Uncharacterized protein n=1 Tax=Cucumis melo TaxID=3656 RepID=A0A9I9D776_CUCME
MVEGENGNDRSGGGGRKRRQWWKAKTAEVDRLVEGENGNNDGW